MHRPLISLLLFMALVPGIFAWTMSWCEYNKHWGISTPECEEQQRFRPAPVPEIEVTPQPVTFPLHPLCHGYYHSCMESSVECESGTVCTNTITNSRCCTSPKSRCPSPSQMNIQCQSANPTNWCYQDTDCGSNFDQTQMCCPTGCNYNICLADRTRAQPPLFPEGPGDSQFFALIMSPECPDPFSIPMNCVVPNPVSWCFKHSDCPSANSLHPRRCCRTQCGYNACHVKFNGQWMIA